MKLLIATLVTALLAGCGGGGSTQPQGVQEYPQYKSGVDGVYFIPRSDDSVRVQGTHRIIQPGETYTTPHGTTGTPERKP